MKYQRRVQALTISITRHPLFKWILFAILLMVILPLINWDDFRHALKEISLFVLCVFAAFMLLSRFLYAVRLHTLLVSQQNHISIWNVFRVNLLGDFISIALPTFITGDMMRVYKLNKLTERSTTIISATIIDRMIGLVTMALLALFLMSSLGRKISWTLPISPLLLSVSVLAGSIIAIVFVWKFSKSKIKSRVEFLAFRPYSLILAGLISISGHLAFSSAYYIAFREFFDISIIETIGMVMLAQTTKAIPVSILGIGPNEGSMFFLGQLVGIKSETIIVVLVLALGTRYLLALSGLIWEFISDGRNFLGEIRSKDFDINRV